MQRIVEWNPSATIDSSFLELVPYLSSIDMEEYPISAKDLKKIADQATSQGKINAAMGAYLLWNYKEAISENTGEFRSIHLTDLDRGLFMLTIKDLSPNMQFSVQWYFKLVFENWCRTLPRAKLQANIKAIQQVIALLQQSLVKIDEKVEVTIKCIITTLHDQMEDANTKADHDYFFKKFQQYRRDIANNERHILLLRIINEGYLIMAEHLYALESNCKPVHSVQIIHKKLFYLSQNQRLSLSIELMAFVFKKILKIHQRISSSEFAQLMEIICVVIDRYQIVRVNLNQRPYFFSYYMKKYQYFYYLEEFYKIHRFGDQNIIAEWKLQIRKSIERQEKQVKPTFDNIQEAIFYIQLRQKDKYLFSESKYIWDFPDIQAKVVQKILKDEVLNFKQCGGSGIRVGERCSRKLVTNIEAGVKYYRQLNRFERGVFVYYIHYDKFCKLNARHAKPQKELSIIQSFFSKLQSDEIIELISFFLMEIELGNYYGIVPQQTLMLNDVAYFLYRSIAKQIFRRTYLMLQNQTRITTTKELNIFHQLAKHYAILQNALYRQQDYIKICRKCRNVLYGQNNYECSNCEEILLGVKLKVSTMSQQLFNGWGFSKFYYYLSYQLQKKGKALRDAIVLTMNKNKQKLNIEFFQMCSLVFDDALLRLR